MLLQQTRRYRRWRRFLRIASAEGCTYWTWRDTTTVASIDRRRWTELVQWWTDGHKCRNPVVCCNRATGAYDYNWDESHFIRHTFTSSHTNCRWLITASSWCYLIYETVSNSIWAKAMASSSSSSLGFGSSCWLVSWKRTVIKAVNRLYKLLLLWQRCLLTRWIVGKGLDILIYLVECAM